MNSGNTFKTWAINQALGLSLGWFFHSVISHLWTGDHEYTLTTAQFIMHNVSLTGCAFIFLYFQNRATTQLFNLNLFRYWLYYLTIPTILFWIGFYLEAVPLDVLLWFLSVGFLNGYTLKKQATVTNQWLAWSTVSALIGFVVAAALLIPLDGYLTSLKGLAAHIVMFTLLGVTAGIPMALLGGRMLTRSLIIPERDRGNSLNH